MLQRRQVGPHLRSRVSDNTASAQAAFSARGSYIPLGSQRKLWLFIGGGIDDKLAAVSDAFAHGADAGGSIELKMNDAPVAG